MPAFGYGIAFLAMIPCYGLIYFLFIPNDFYHTSITRERPYFEAVVALDDQLRTVLVGDLREAYGGNVIDVGEGEVICIDRLRTAGFTVDDLGPASFQISVPISAADAVAGDECPSDSIRAIEVLDAAIDLGRNFDVFEDPEAVGLAPPAWLTLRFTSSDSYAALRRLFPPPPDGPAFRVSEQSEGQYQVAMPPDVARQLQNVLRASQGFPSGISGELSRMLYLSAITATTTGYGDIVPITTRARFLTASEAILGLILVGLFLNSVSQRRGRANQD